MANLNLNGAELLEIRLKALNEIEMLKEMISEKDTDFDDDSGVGGTTPRLKKKLAEINLPFWQNIERKLKTELDKIYGEKLDSSNISILGEVKKSMST